MPSNARTLSPLSLSHQKNQKKNIHLFSSFTKNGFLVFYPNIKALFHFRSEILFGFFHVTVKKKKKNIQLFSNFTKNGFLDFYPNITALFAFPFGNSFCGFSCYCDNFFFFHTFETSTREKYRLFLFHSYKFAYSPPT